MIRGVRIKDPRLTRRLVMIALLLVFSALLAGLTVPWAAERAMERSFKQGLQAKVVIADVKASSAWRLFAGKTDSMSLAMEFDDASLISLSQLHAAWGKSNVALGLMRRGEGGARDAEPHETELHWDSSRLAAYLNRVQGEVLVSRVEINAEAVGIYGSVSIAGGKRNIYLSGKPRCNDLGQVVFSAENFRVEGLADTEQFRQNIVNALAFYPDLAPLQWQVWAKQIVLSDNKIIVYGSSSCCH